MGYRSTRAWSLALSLGFLVPGGCSKQGVGRCGTAADGGAPLSGQARAGDGATPAADGAASPADGGGLAEMDDPFLDCGGSWTPDLSADGGGHRDGGAAPDAGPPRPWEAEEVGRGPRPLPPTFVQLELPSFPRPAAQACADNTRTLRVAPGGSISAALAAATPGTTVWVAPGTYVERPIEGNALEWKTPNVCLRAEGGGGVVLQAAPEQRHGIAPEGDDTVIEGFTLRGFVSGVSFWTGNGETQHRVTLQRLRVEQPVGTFGEGIVAYGDNGHAPDAPPVLDGLLLLDVTVAGTDLGIACNSGPCQHWWIERTTVSGRRGSGTSGADTIAVEQGRQIVVLDSTVRDAEADGIDLKATDVVVFGVHVQDIARNGIKLWQGGDVIDTVLDGTGADAALAGSRPGRYRYLHVLVGHHATPADRQYVGTWGYDAPGPGFRLEIVNSIFWSCASGGLSVPPDSQISLRHNLFDNPQAKLLATGGTQLMVSDLATLDARGWGSGNLLGDPRFVAPQQHRYQTAADSPARDRAERIDGLLRDCDGGERLFGAGPDIGPAESRE